MRNAGIRGLLVLAAMAGMAPVAAAQEPATRAALIEQEEAAKVPTLRPYEPNSGERWAQKAQDILVGGGLHWHPFFENAYAGGGFTLGAGYMNHVSPYNLIDVRGSYTVSGYKRAEAEFLAPRLFERRGELSVLGGWREATEVGFYGVGIDTSTDDKTNYLFRQPYASALLTIRPTRRFLTLRGGFEWSQWEQAPGQGRTPSVETKYTPETLPGLGATVNYLHTQATVGLDYRTSPGYSRRGGFVGITGHDYMDRDESLGFQRVDYEVVQHVPILREAWAISLHGLASTAYSKGGQAIPFFMLPSLGGGSNLRGFGSWRFRDLNSLLIQGEWRIMVNRFMDTAVFYDTGTVAPRMSQLDFTHMKHDVGFGVRLHGPLTTPLRVELAKSNEGLAIVFASSAAF
jgi:Omp85 superfamily domain